MVLTLLNSFFLLVDVAPIRGNIDQRYILLIAGAVLLLLAVTLVVYFRKRMKKVEKETQEDWDMGMRSIFITPPAQATEEPIVDEQREFEPGGDEVAPARITQDLEEVEAIPGEAAVSNHTEQVALEDEETHVPAEHTKLLYSEPYVEPEPEMPAQEVTPEIPVETTEAETRRETVSLESNQTDEAVFDEEVWARLETATLQSPQAEEAAPVERTTEPLSGYDEVEPSREARVEHRAPREPFEAPRIDPITHRAPFEPPTIEPLTPREQASFMRESSAQARRPADEREATSRQERFTESSLASREHHDPEHVAGLDEREIPTTYTGPPVDRVTTAPPIESVRVRKAPAGSVLGLPAESSDKPLVLGEPVRSEDAGIEALSRYGARPKEKTGHAGTIALLIILLLIGGIIGAYFVLPAFRNWVDATYAGMRGKPAEDKTAKARIAGYSPTATNNLARAGGVVENISNETLEGLMVEVTLKRADGTVVETRTMGVEPPALQPGERGRFEIEYPIEGGVLQPIVTKLTGSNGQIIFTTNQK
jgi:hypothetical protein